MDLRPGTEVDIGVRPEDVRIDSKAGCGAIRATVNLVEPTGAESLISCRMGSLPFLAAVRDRHSGQFGDSIHLSLPPDKIHVFDRSSGQRLVAG